MEVGSFSGFKEQNLGFALAHLAKGLKLKSVKLPQMPKASVQTYKAIINPASVVNPYAKQALRTVSTRIKTQAPMIRDASKQAISEQVENSQDAMDYETGNYQNIINRYSNQNEEVSGFEELLNKVKNLKPEQKNQLSKQIENKRSNKAVKKDKSKIEKRDIKGKKVPQKEKTVKNYSKNALSILDYTPQGISKKIGEKIGKSVAEISPANIGKETGKKAHDLTKSTNNKNIKTTDSGYLDKYAMISGGVVVLLLIVYLMNKGKK